MIVQDAIVEGCEDVTLEASLIATVPEAVTGNSMYPTDTETFVKVFDGDWLTTGTSPVVVNVAVIDEVVVMIESLTAPAATVIEAEDEYCKPEIVTVSVDADT